MKIYSVVLALLLGLGVATQADAQFGRGQNPRQSDQVCVYTDNYFMGSEQCYRPGDEISDIRGRSISSIRIYGRARVTVYEQRNFTGNSTQFTSDVVDLVRVPMSGSNNWNDRISSLQVASQVTSDNRGYPDNRYPDNGGVYQGDRSDQRDRDLPGRRRGQQTQNEVCVFENANYQGASQCFTSGEDIQNLAGFRGLGDRISSIRIYGQARAILFQNAGFQGARLVVDRDIPDLARVRMRGNVTWNDQVSSLEVQGSRSNRDGRISTNR